MKTSPLKFGPSSNNTFLPHGRTTVPSRSTAALVLNGLFALVFGVCADSAETASAGPGLQFDETHYDFGRVNGGETVAHEFAFINPHVQAVGISGVKSSCGCVVVGAWPTKVEGGETGVIPVQFATANYAGHVREQVIVTFTEAALPPIKIEIEATVWWPVEISPRTAVFEFGGNSGSNVVATVRITNQEAASLELQDPVTSHRALAATLQTNRPGQEFEVTIRTAPPLPSGNLFGDVTLKSSAAKMPRIVIPVSGLFQPDVLVSPSRLTVPAGTAAQPRQQTVTIRSFWTNALVLGTATLSRAGVAAEVRPKKPGREFEVIVTIPADMAIAPGEKVELRIETNHPRYRVLRVPLGGESAAATP